MTIQFNISHIAAYGEEMTLNIVEHADDGIRITPLYMATADGHNWTYRLECAETKPHAAIDYFFSIGSAGREAAREWTGTLHRLDLNLTRGKRLNVDNVWHDAPRDNRFYTSAYTRCLCMRQPAQPGRTAFQRTVRLIVRAPQLRPGERLAIAGGCRCLGDWRAECAAAMTEHNTCEWQADINAANIAEGTEYKFVAVDADGNAEWETGDNRTLNPCGDMQQGDALVVELAEARFDRSTPSVQCHFMSIARLRSPECFGIGDFGCLAQFIADKAAGGGPRMVCIPPVCDTISTHSAADSNPFSCISVYALHPLLCDLRQLPPIADNDKRTAMETLRLQLNATASYDYLATLRAKLQYLGCIFQQEGDRTMHSAAFRRFFAANEQWLVPYAQYSYLRDAYGIADFRQWPNHTEWTEAERGQLQNPRTKAYKKLAFFYYVQYVLHCQLRHVHETARKHGIVLTGDLTANVNPNGCDTWQEQDNVGSDDWWTRRLAAMEAYYDACRVAKGVKERRRLEESTDMWIDTFE